MEPGRAVDAHNGGMKAQNGSMKSRIRIQVKRRNLDPHQRENADPDLVSLQRQIRNPDPLQSDADRQHWLRVYTWPKVPNA
jgi:hypothetical protein